ncbi:hypothetical protein TVAG_295580 [Trichomonas vaginalis G3]|uniref:Uncharacterized protein n=1 Tax=Trichomonas vaginalis (strain ATCC PRA-98 / G3) TaxID=412133 RepID=A2F225_TRIV3|nr:hypothetical protein TVAGG3_0971500 [Trichomonas vaginalis G3]EAY01024.1 hypothetical protein TVAG_295580 [Trichomonas vaginalis G3]KAI5488619.1 hypothetical protein TVAGG3_0971500 [Trichomonas vaginalis G3]|eukprot:XP_001313910.1 hypothetical protein [Trichomonas vaginalis G3]
MFNGDNGSLPCYIADEPVLNTSDHFQVEWNEKLSRKMTLSLNAFNKNGLRYQIGNQELEIPIEAIIAGKTPTQSVQITSKAGTFSICIKFEKGIFTEETQNPNSTSLMSLIKPIELYSELISSLRPMPDTIHPANDLWSSSGFSLIFDSFSKSDLVLEEITQLEEVQYALESKNNNIHWTAKLISLTIHLMLNKQRLYITEKGDIGLEPNLTGIKRFPLLAVVICYYIKTGISIKDDNLDSIIMLICNIVCTKETNDELNYYILTTIYTIKRYLESEFSKKYPTIIAVLQSASQTALSNFLIFFLDSVPPITHDSKQVTALLKDWKMSFIENGFGENFVNSIMKMMFKITDFLVVRKWIFDMDTETVDMGSLISEFSEYSFPLIHSLTYLIAFAKKIIKKRIFPDEIVPEMRGEWYMYIMFRLVNCKKFEFTEKEINALHPTKAVPDYPDIDEWAFDNKDMAHDPLKKIVFPKIPQEYL